MFHRLPVVHHQLQVTPPATDTRRRRAFDEHDGHNDDEQQGQTPLTVHPTLSSVYLPPPDPSSTISTVFGTARTDASDQTDHLYASQVAAILFARARSDVGGDDEQNEDVGESRQILGQGKPVIVGLGLKPSFVEAGDGSIDQGRERFAGVMKMVGDAVALLRG